MNQVKEELLQLLSTKCYKVSMRNARKIRFPSNYKFENHSHSEVEINYINSGNCIMGIGERIVPLKRGDCIVISPFEKHMFVVDDRKTCSITQLEYSVSTPAVVLEHTLCLTYDKEYYVLRNCESLSELMGSICRIFRGDIRNVYIEAQLEFAMAQLYALLSGYIKEHQRQSDVHQGKLGELLDVLHERLEYDINIEEIAKELGISSRYVRKVFAEQIGVSCSSYITLLRIARAKEMLWDSEKDITDVAILSGFNSSQYFCRIFKKHTGITPMEYRNLWRGIIAKMEE